MPLAGRPMLSTMLASWVGGMIGARFLPELTTRKLPRPLRGRNYGGELRNTLFDRDGHRVGTRERLDARLREPGLAHPSLAVGSRKIEAARRFDQHVQAHQQTKRVFAPLVVDDRLIENERAALGKRGMRLFQRRANRRQDRSGVAASGRATYRPGCRQKHAFAVWAIEQGRLLEETASSAKQKAVGAEIILKCGGTIGNLPVAYSFYTWLTLEELRPLIASKLHIAVHVGEITYDDTDPVTRNDFDTQFTPSQDLIIVPMLSEDFMHPVRFGRDLRTSSLLSVFKDLLQNVWGVFEASEDDEYVVGSACGEEIIRSVTIYTRAGSTS